MDWYWLFGVVFAAWMSISIFSGTREEKLKHPFLRYIVGFLIFLSVLLMWWFVGNGGDLDGLLHGNEAPIHPHEPYP